MCLLNVMTFFCGTRFILWYNIRLTCLKVSLPSSALFTRSNVTCNQKPKRSFRQKNIWIFLRHFILFHFCFYLCLLSCRPNKNNTGCFPKARTGRPNHGFFQEFLMKNYFLYACYLGFDLSGWIALIKSEILTTTGMAWPVSSDKWRVP